MHKLLLILFLCMTPLYSIESGKLEGKRAFITGGNRGIGKAIALTFAKEGADIAFTYNSHPDEARIVVDQITKLGRRAIALQADMSVSGEVKKVALLGVEFLGRVDILVNNAGLIRRTSFVDIPEEELDLIFAVNFKGAFLLTQLMARNMIQEKKGGSIINISSISAYRTVPNLAHYQCTKAALSMMSKGASLELAPYQIRVNSIESGLTQTDLNRNQWEGDATLWEKRVARIPLGRCGTAQDHAEVAVFLASDASSWITGASIPVDGGTGSSL